MRELTELEIDQLDFSGRIPDLNPDNYQLIGLVSDTALKREPSRKATPYANHSVEKRHLKTG